jgi:dipeptidyl aminopeptidase/acylaminoacyl peptidase
VDARDGSSAVVLKSPGVFLWTGLDWSPDGSHIVVATRNSTSEPWRLMRIPLTAGERRWMSTPPAGSLGDCYPAYSPDGASIAFIRDTGSERSLMLRDLARGAESQLTSASSDISRPVWTMDGRHLIYSTYVAAGNAANSLWTVATSGGEPRRIIGTGDGAGYPSTARHTERLAYLQTRVDYNLYKADLSKRPPAVVAFPGSSQMDSSPDVSPDGSRVVFVSDRSGPTEIWTMAVDGSDARPVTTMNGHTRRPRWSPDGRQVAFDARASGSYHTDIYVVNARGGEPRRLTTDVSQDTWATWSADGQWIYYLRHVRGSPEIWKVPAAGGPPEQITHDHGLSAQESTDGRFLYYSTAARELWRVRLGGGVRQLMLKMPSRTEWGGLWTVTDAGIYWLNADGSPHPAIDFLSFATGRSSRAFTPPGSVAMGSNISVSRDRRLLLLAQLDYGSSDVMMLEAGEPRSR